MTRHRSDPSALKLSPAFPAESSGIRRVACLRPVTLEPSFTSVSSPDEPTVILHDAAAIRHRARLAAKACADRSARREYLHAACWVVAACAVTFFVGRALAVLLGVAP